MSVYPLPMRFPVPIDGSSGKRARAEGRELVRGEYIDVRVDADGWRFITPADQLTFDQLPAGDRLEYRRAFAAQVELAQSTPTKEPS